MDCVLELSRGIHHWHEPIHRDAKLLGNSECQYMVMVMVMVMAFTSDDSIGKVGNLFLKTLDVILHDFEVSFAFSR